jgi:hypothetical protein
MKTTIIIAALLLAIPLISYYLSNRKKPKSMYANDYERDYEVILGWIHNAKKVDSLYNYVLMIEKFEVKHRFESHVHEDGRVLRSQLANKADELIKKLKLRHMCLY